jgi:hypothetical protein
MVSFGARKIDKKYGMKHYQAFQIRWPDNIFKQATILSFQILTCSPIMVIQSYSMLAVMSPKLLSQFIALFLC